MTLVSFNCAHCGCATSKTSSSVNRASRLRAPLFCGRICSGMSKRKNKTSEQKKAEKREYDALRRLALYQEIRKKKAEHYAKNKDREKEREDRKRRMPMHVEYCRRPQYKAKKATYDKMRIDMQYGEFAECNRLLMELESLIRSSMSRYERYVARGYYERQQQRRQQNV